MRSRRHRHVFTALWGHFGPYGPQNQHYHTCFADECEVWLHGDGVDCAQGARHRRVRVPNSAPKSGAARDVPVSLINGVGTADAPIGSD